MLRWVVVYLVSLLNRLFNLLLFLNLKRLLRLKVFLIFVCRFRLSVFIFSF